MLDMMPRKTTTGVMRDLGGGLHGLLQQGVNHAGLLSHAHAQHGNQHHAQGGVGGEVAHSVGEDIGQAVLGQQADRGDSGRLELAIGDQIAGSGYPCRGADGGNDDDCQGKNAKQGDGVGQLIAHGLNAVEPAVVCADLLGARRVLT